MILYVLIILVLASFVVAFFSAKTWHWGYVVLVEAILLATLGFFLLAAETLRINGVLRTEANAREKQLAEATAEVEGLKKGTDDANVLNRLRNTDPPTKMAEDAASIDSLENMDHELLIATRLRGRVWREVVPAGVDPKTGAIKVSIPKPAPVGLNTKEPTVVFLFEEGPPQPPAPNGAPRGPQYLGEFTAIQTAPQQASLQPVQQMQPNDFESRRLAASRGPWIMYETMPADRYEIFAGLKEDQLKQILPKQSINEYLRHGKEATADDDPWRKLGLDVDGNPLPPDQIGKASKVLYQRRLRDYAAEFDELSRRRVSMLAEIDAVKKDIEKLTAADVSAKKLQASLTDQQQKLTTDKAGITKEREAIEKHLAQVEQLLAKALQLTNETLAHNRQLAAELAARQLRPRPANGPGSSIQKPEPLALDRAK